MLWEVRPEMRHPRCPPLASLHLILIASGCAARVPRPHASHPRLHVTCVSFDALCGVVRRWICMRTTLARCY
jgi:hypothetical protein